MNRKGPEFFLDVLCLAVYSDDETTQRILNAVIEIFDEEESENSDFQDELSKFYITLVKSIVQDSLELSKKGDVAALVVKLKQHPLVKDDPSIVEDIKEIINNRDEATKRRVTNLQKNIRNWALLHKNSKTMRTMFAKKQKASQTSNGVMQELLLSEILDHAKEIVSAHDSSALVSENIDFIDMSNRKSLIKSLQSFKDKRVTKTWKSGLQGLNGLFGPSHDGAAPGEFIGFAALSYHYKSGMLMNWARWICTLNTPLPRGKGKQDAIVFFSLENEVFENQMEWFKTSYANTFGEPGDKLTDEEIIDYVIQTYGMNGIQLLVFRKMGDEFGYEEYIREIETLENRGYRIIGSIIDYATLMKFPEDQGSNDAKKLQLLCNRIGNYANHKGMTTITGFQLGTEAQVLADSGVINVVNKFGAAHLADCKGIMRELDVLFFMHIEKNHQGIPFVTMKIVKHKYCRLPSNTYTAYRLHETLGLLDDINGESQEVNDIYSYRVSGGLSNEVTLVAGIALEID